MALFTLFTGHLLLVQLNVTAGRHLIGAQLTVADNYYSTTDFVTGCLLVAQLTVADTYCSTTDFVTGYLLVVQLTLTAGRLLLMTASTMTVTKQCNGTNAVDRSRTPTSAQMTFTIDILLWHI